MQEGSGSHLSLGNRIPWQLYPLEAIFPRRGFSSAGSDSFRILASYGRRNCRVSGQYLREERVMCNPDPTTAVVTLRHLSVNGVRHGTGACTAGTQGIRFLAGKVLHIESVVVFGFSSNGVDVNNTTSLPTVTIQDSTITDNGASGVSVTATSAIGATISNTTIKQNGTGVSSAANSRVTIRDSKLASNTTGVITASGSETNITDSLVSGSTTGINVVSGATVRLGNDTIAQNSTGVANPAGSTVQSTGDSRFMGNPVDRTGAAFSPLVKQ